MAIQQTKKQSDLEKRLMLLRRQVYGKEPDRSVKSDKIRDHQQTGKSENLAFRYTETQISSGTPISSDLAYLRHDLLKILIFSSFAIGAQIVLFFLLKNHILNLNFF
ncbi:hypothetical protein A2867_03255 [Candidatus Daviesbacteria bacterium RIFCSPHIGHO2_01_FULL_40_11]|uniref:Uncharacterized protein n=1 Tax=Candidatus Daviesbacteria bacterium RIFCSPHIGHO2_01_FULL_40_11 TaxID=1797762 RepID=A0A1F5JL12_9BACT|nr:MAG: hypothetical protein A2867_03255 [Candidatus Daviesbacteria bacterium RIFCSPHIGHO2_01_FULL_40_11]OGE63038.1 MAG: hypothetical protein A2964_02375 [Candidatus Daviesbacteria bacterium RIFCSPLOWO2_01_FULL_40_27]